VPDSTGSGDADSGERIALERGDPATDRQPIAARLRHQSI